MAFNETGYVLVELHFFAVDNGARQRRDLGNVRVGESVSFNTPRQLVFPRLLFWPRSFGAEEETGFGKKGIRTVGYWGGRLKKFRGGGAQGANKKRWPGGGKRRGEGQCKFPKVGSEGKIEREQGQERTICFTVAIFRESGRVDTGCAPGIEAGGDRSAGGEGLGGRGWKRGMNTFAGGPICSAGWHIRGEGGISVLHTERPAMSVGGAPSNPRRGKGDARGSP